MKKGFTLIELLAVIVILAIIALIATPIIISIIENTKGESEKRSVDLYASAIKNAIASYQLTHPNVPTSIDDLTIEYDGDVVCETREIYEDGNIYLADCTVNGSKVEGYTYGKQRKQKFKTYANGEVVYFNVTKGKGCPGEYTETQSKTGTKTGCMKFYAFNDEGENSGTLNLILDHNTTAKVVWNLSGSNTTVPNEVLTQLQTDTADWEGTIEPSTYEYKGAARPYTINYTGYKARLITANEIAKITGNEGWDEASTSSRYYYLDSLTTSSSPTCKKGNTSGCKYGWLYDRTSTSCTTYGCLNNSDVSTAGYWSASPTAYDSGYAWGVSYLGDLGTGLVGDAGRFGVRPVITISKSSIN